MKLNHKLLFAILLIIISMILSNIFFIQIDFTNDKRYSLSKNSLNEIKKIDEPLIIDIFLTGNLPKAYLPFRNELDAILNRLKYYNNKIILKYNDPLEYGDSESISEDMLRFGLTPEIVVQNKNGNREENIIFPWLIFNYKGKSEKIRLLKKQLGNTQNENIFNSMQLLENKIMDGIYRVNLRNKRNIAFLSSHGTTKKIKIADLLKNLKPYYNLSGFNLKNSKITPLQRLNDLMMFDLLIISNASKKFSPIDKYILDQYSLRGGKLIWMINGVAMDNDSLFNESGKSYALPQELNLEDYFFHKGIRIEKTLIQDLYCAPIVLASGYENNAQYVPYPWVYYPIIKPNDSIIGKDTGPILCRYASPIKTIDNKLSKFMLLKSSDFIKTSSYPAVINLKQATSKIEPSTFLQKSKAISYLVEGQNYSLFKNRIKPFKFNGNMEKGKFEMVIISDGNIAENQIDKGIPLSLGYDKWTNNFYSNRAWLVNVIHFLAGNKNYLSTRGKKWNFAFFDISKINKFGTFWKWSLILFPYVIGIFSILLSNRLRNKQLKL
ncbi:gliding motility-associated ABC transporter substrate-binding protein GldG [Bacteroidetes bacterium SCGC AAA795-G10]|nr:gliding motility-associated ABC transporter substrate-binding protein GldG [Bacteroidetes bacterium SCGC AAA795-G10]